MAWYKGMNFDFLTEWDYWQGKGYNWDQIATLVNYTAIYDLKNRPDQVIWLLNQAGYKTYPTGAETMAEYTERTGWEPSDTFEEAQEKMGLTPNTYWEALGYSTEQAHILALKSDRYNLIDRLDQRIWFLSTANLPIYPIGTVGSPGDFKVVGSHVVATKPTGEWYLFGTYSTVAEAQQQMNIQLGAVVTPTVTPTVTPPPDPTTTTTPPGPEQYIITIKTIIHPSIPQWVQDKMRVVMLKRGWELVSIEQTDEGYLLNLNSVGTAPIILLIPLLKVLLVVIGIAIIGYVILKVSDNSTQAGEVSDSISDALSYCEAEGLTADECNEVINAIKNTYAEVSPPPKDGILGLGGLFENLPILIGGIMVITLIQTLKK